MSKGRSALIASTPITTRVDPPMGSVGVQGKILGRETHSSSRPHAPTPATTREMMRLPVCMSTSPCLHILCYPKTTAAVLLLLHVRNYVFSSLRVAEIAENWSDFSAKEGVGQRLHYPEASKDA